MAIVSTLFWAIFYYMVFVPFALVWRSVSRRGWRRKSTASSKWRAREGEGFSRLDGMR